ncbi:unnamed protein product [Callosobruchus maculatus]|uniref:Uncharacterized protein n=1 Tax=Callosobruchus maculatus TaxID=64391 RepID=A0A653C9M8_CALMS|nr:unnamed protein product [Callosobruchus maculatus]
MCFLTWSFNLVCFIRSKEVCDDDEEEFYYTEVELGLTSPPPTLSHRDMARPFHEDPDYQRLLVGNMRQSLLAQAAANAGIGTMPPQSPHKLLKLSPRVPHQLVLTFNSFRRSEPTMSSIRFRPK